MPTLAIATSGPDGGLALQCAAGTVYDVPLAAGRGRGRDVMPALQGLLADAGLGAADLTTLVVDVGPGSFTGVRVGVTVAKTLAWTLGLEVRAVNSLDLLAACAPADGAVLAVRDAGRGTVYHRRAAPGGEPILGRSPGETLRDAAAGSTIVGEEAAALAERFAWQGRPLDVRPGAKTLLRLGLSSQAGTVVRAHDLAPLYLQASAPERKAAGEQD